MTSSAVPERLVVRVLRDLMWVDVHGVRADGCSVTEYYEGYKVAGKILWARPFMSTRVFVMELSCEEDSPSSSHVAE